MISDFIEGISQSSTSDIFINYQFIQFIFFSVEFIELFLIPSYEFQRKSIIHLIRFLAFSSLYGIRI